jgi:hypothetical protein
MKAQTFFSSFMPVIAAVFVAFSLATSARAQVITSNVITSNPNLPVLAPIGYYTNGQANVTYNGPGVIINLTNIGHSALGPVNPVPSGPNEIETFNSLLMGEGNVNGIGLIFTASGPVTTEVFNKIGNVTGTFNTEMLSMNLTGSTPFGTLMIRESPTLPSLGQTTINNIGGGQFQINSFFDVFTELSLDGGNTWIPSVTGSERVTLVQPIPEPTVCALAGLAAGLLAIKRSRWLGKKTGRLDEPEIRN